MKHIERDGTRMCRQRRSWRFLQTPVSGGRPDERCAQSGRGIVIPTRSSRTNATDESGKSKSGCSCSLTSATMDHLRACTSCRAPLPLATSAPLRLVSTVVGTNHHPVDTDRDTFLILSYFTSLRKGVVGWSLFRTSSSLFHTPHSHHVFFELKQRRRG